MVAIYDNSRIEIWCSKYINNFNNIRSEADKNARIVQIEHGNNDDDYIVEVIDKEEEI